MTPIQRLISLTQLFLLREYPLKKMHVFSPEAYAFFQKKMPAAPLPHPAKREKPSTFYPAQPSPPMKISAHPGAPTPLPSSPVPKPALSAPSPIAAPTKAPPPPSPLPAPSSPTLPLDQDQPNKIKEDLKGLSARKEITSAFEPAQKLPGVDDRKGFGAVSDAEVISLRALTLEPLAEVKVPRDDRDLRVWFPRLFPETAVCESIPDDSLAKNMQQAHVERQAIPAVILLSFHDNDLHVRFLKNLAQAISLRFAPARVLSALKWEKEKGWASLLTSPSLRLIIASDYSFYLQTELKPFHREIPHQGKHFLKDIPLLLLSDLSLYLKEPPLKSLLWRAICDEFTASS